MDFNQTCFQLCITSFNKVLIIYINYLKITQYVIIINIIHVDMV